MSRRLALVVITSIFLLGLHGFTAFAQIISNDEFLGRYGVEVSSSAAYVSVPFYYQSNNYYCGVAALEMVFDYYGEDIPQEEIADVARTYPYVTYTDELRRAAHFSNLSTSLGDEMSGNITGYSARQIGFGAFEQGGLTIDDLKLLIDRKEPVILLMWWTPSKIYGHYRVVIGYNETHITMHDPWNKDAWGGVYGGANTSMTYSTFLDLWEYLGYWGLLVSPWDVELQIPEIVVEGENFEAAVNITYTCFTPFDLDQYPAYSCNATIQLSEGLELASGETRQHSLGNIKAGSCAHTSWSLKANETGFHNISVAVAGMIEGSVGTHGTYPSYDYEDAIGGSCIDSLLISNQTQTVHNLDTGHNYTTIQEAIDAPETLIGHTIFVEEGTYYEHVTVSKSLTLLGENRETTIIDGNMTGHVVSITQDRVNVTGFTVQRSGGTNTLIESGIYLSSTSHCNIFGNRLVDNYVGIFGSPRNTSISNNALTNNHVGVDIHHHATYNIISGNCLMANNLSIHIYNADSNSIFENNITNNRRTITLGYSKNNRFYHNNFFNNTQQILILAGGYANFWDDGYPSGGNFWSEHTDADLNRDGIVDSPFIIDADNTDNFPLMGAFSEFDITSEYSVQAICNSTISDFQFNGTAITFNVSGENDTVGFCRMCIPKALMNDTYRVFVNGTEVECTPLTEISNTTHNYIYFTYNHSTQKVIIISEFPSFFILPLFMTATLLSIIAYRRQLKKRSARAPISNF